MLQYDSQAIIKKIGWEIKVQSVFKRRKIENQTKSHASTCQRICEEKIEEK